MSPITQQNGIAPSSELVAHAVTLVGSLTKIMDPGVGNKKATLGVWKWAINH